MLTAIVGINWGDEGKGRMVDLLGGDYDIIVRYQGGNNAGHTVINERGKFILNLLPSGILREDAVNVMGNGMVIDIEHLAGEIDALNTKGIKITPDNLKISDKAIICMPVHKQQDILEEERLRDKKYGSTRRGIAPVYADKYMKKALRMGDLCAPATLRDKVKGFLDWKNLILEGAYNNKKMSVTELMNWLEKFGRHLMPHVCDTGGYLYSAIDAGKNIMFEAQLGALRDIDYGIYPYTTSSNTLAAYAPIGSGIPSARLDGTIGIMKAYSSCVGEGPFTVEMSGAEAEALRAAGSEYGAATGRPRRVGAFDVPASRYGIKLQGAETLALTKLDVMSYMDKIPVCVGYRIDGAVTSVFPSGDRLARAEPVFEYLEGFKTDISECRSIRDLPKAALDYIRYIEKAVGCRIKYVSVGAERDDYIILR
ncbi:MAG: adenylosuccinate synthase [Clostridiales bacterium]|jgi:adenylosuccinate synthase|nr:adenylosuccinate synthase [Clostridiales bacterium]